MEVDRTRSRRRTLPDWALPGGASSARPFLAALLAMTLALALYLAAPAGAQPLSPESPLYSPGAPLLDENPNVTADYKGSITEEYNFPGEMGTNSHTVEATLSWEESVTGPVDQIEYTGIYGESAIHWHLGEFKGSVTDHLTDGDGHPSMCSGTFSSTTTDGGTGGVFLPLDEPGAPAGGGNPATNPDYEVIPPHGLPFSLLSSAVKGSGSDPYCATQSWNGSGSTTWGFLPKLVNGGSFPAAWTAGTAPNVYFPPGTSFSQPIEYPYACKGNCPSNMASASVQLISSLTFSSPGLPSPTQLGPIQSTTPPSSNGGGGPPPPTPANPRPTRPQKEAAQEDIRQTLKEAAVQCSIAALGVSGLVAGVIAPEIGAASVLAVAGPTGAMVLAAAGPICATLIKRAYDDGKIVNDPPIGGIYTLARPARAKGHGPRLPSCARFKSRLRSFCESLRGDELRYIAAVQASQSIDDALLTTVERETAAYEAGNQGALAAQERNATALRARFNAALGRQHSAGVAISGLIGSQHLRVRLTRPQAQKGIAAVLIKLSKLGLSRAQASQLGGSALAPGPVDVLAELTR